MNPPPRRRRTDALQTGESTLPRFDAVPAGARRVEATARDKRTLELRQFLRLPRRMGEEVAYQTSFFLYFPRAFGISPTTWGRDAFYQDVSSFMRLHAPELRLSQLADLEHPTNPASILRRQLPMLLEEKAPSAASLDLLAKTLGAELADAATAATRALRADMEQLGVGDNKAVLVAQVETFAKDVERAISAVRRLRAKARAFRTVAPPTLLPALAFAEEFSSGIVEERLAELCAFVDQHPGLHDGKGTALRLRLALAKAADAVVRRRVEQGFATPAGDSPEYFTYRQSLLKKEVQRALYVDTRSKRSDPFFKNSAAMVAAGLAATWATLAQVPLLTGRLTTSQTALFLGAAVGAYILKDRIKEWTRDILTRRLMVWDHDRQLVGDALAAAGLGSFGGRAQERVRWVKDDEVPPSVRDARAKYRTVRGVAPELEHCLCYQRNVTFEAGPQAVPEGFGVQELFRLSLDELCKRLDDPVDEVSYFDPAMGAFKKAEMPRVYHLNVIAVLSSPDDAHQLVTRFRVVVNQDGVLHIDPVLEQRVERDAVSP